MGYKNIICIYLFKHFKQRWALWCLKCFIWESQALDQIQAYYFNILEYFNKSVVQNFSKNIFWLNVFFNRRNPCCTVARIVGSSIQSSFQIIEMNLNQKFITYFLWIYWFYEGSGERSFLEFQHSNWVTLTKSTSKCPLEGSFKRNMVFQCSCQMIFMNFQWNIFCRWIL